MSALDSQVGGGHYKDMAIQPIEFTHKNNLNFCQGNVIKYICRYKNKNGLEDLKKVKHYVDLLIELEGYVVEKELPEDLQEIADSRIFKEVVSFFKSECITDGHNITKTISGYYCEDCEKFLYPVPKK